MAEIRMTMVKHDFTTGIRYFRVQSTSDLEKLPRTGVKGQDNLTPIKSTAFGSKAFVNDTGATYVLNAENKWQKISTTTSSSGGSTGGDTSGDDDMDFVDKDDVDSLFPDTPTNPDTDSTVDDETLIIPDSNGTVEDETWIIG